ncbi:MAG: biotin/acetyl-CoA-carboxylase ligase [Acidobacteriaceae bacterium]|nr:biotin/acetyl-CoA-carboxylase ligase [Acidobacteriaceae bacterium]
MFTELGFDVAAVEAGIAGTQFAGRVLHFPAVSSTNVLALEAAQQGATGGVWVADEQSAGRGRGRHTWHSVAGDGLYVSALVRPQLPIPMGRALWISLAAGLAAQAAVSESVGLPLDIRWPNDLILNGRKCGGILVETAVAPGEDGAEAMLRYAVIGVGINLNHEAFPEELKGVATSLRIDRGEAVSREAVLSALLRELDGEIRGLVEEPGDGLLERFSAASSWVRGKRVRVDEGGGYTGLTDGLDSNGFLRVAGDDGTLHIVLSGGVREI